MATGREVASKAHACRSHGIRKIDKFWGQGMCQTDAHLLNLPLALGPVSPRLLETFLQLLHGARHCLCLWRECSLLLARSRRSRAHHTPRPLRKTQRSQQTTNRVSVCPHKALCSPLASSPVILLFIDLIQRMDLHSTSRAVLVAKKSRKSLGKEVNPVVWPHVHVEHAGGDVQEGPVFLRHCCMDWELLRGAGRRISEGRWCLGPCPRRDPLPKM